MHARSGTHSGIRETFGQLQDIISRAIQPPKDDISRLKATKGWKARRDEKIADLESTQDLLAENQFIQLCLINDLQLTPQIP